MDNAPARWGPADSGEAGRGAAGRLMVPRLQIARPTAFSIIADEFTLKRWIFHMSPSPYHDVYLRRAMREGRLRHDMDRNGFFRDWWMWPMSPRATS